MMECKKRKYGRKIMYFILGLFCILTPQAVQAKVVINTGDVKMEEGIIIYTVVDTTASSSTTFRTEGFHVKKNAIASSNVGTSKEDIDPTGKPKGTIWMKKEYAKSKDLPDGTTKTTFTIPQKVVDDACEDAEINAASLHETGGKIYLNGIIRVYVSGKLRNDMYYKTLYQMKHAAGWRNPDDFEDRFNIELEYDAKPQPIRLTTMKYSNSNGYKEVSFKQIAKLSSHSTFETDTSMIPGTILSDTTGNKLYLYRVYWTRLKEDKQNYSNGSYRKPRDKISISASVNPIKDWEAYKTALQPLRIRKGTSTDKYSKGSDFYEVLDEGIEIVCVYKNFKSPTTQEDGNTEEVGGDIMEPYASGVIQADLRFAEKFDSQKGIPTTESQYVNVITDDFLIQYRFVHYSGRKEFLQKNGNKTTIVTRSYSYWKIQDLNVYTLAYARVKNGSLPDSYAYLSPSGYYNAPLVDYQVYDTNCEEPAGGGATVGEYKVWNDSLIFNGDIIMDSTKCRMVTSSPKNMPETGRINDNALYKAGFTIPKELANGEYGSEGEVCYNRTTHYGDDAEGNIISYDIEEINDVIVHTPVICDAKIEDVRRYNQLIQPDKLAAGLVLDTYFRIKIPTYGYHSDLKGYKEQDYKKYTAKQEVKFPFDVVKEGNYIAQGTWTETNEEGIFYLPVWVDEGKYTVEFRCRSINADVNNGLTKTEELANTDFENYTAVDSVNVEISGRIYGLNIYDISDYPTWQEVFRKPQSLHLNGNNYTVGIKNRNGAFLNDWTGKELRNSKYTLPIINGSHPSVSNAGAVKSGYYTRFSICTIGNYDGNKDYIQITPKFYFVNGQGGGRQEVDLYYTETFEATGKRHILVKAGSELDQTNIHRINPYDPYFAINGGSTEPDRKEIKGVYTFSNIQIPDTLMRYAGAMSYFDAQENPPIPKAVLEKKKKSVQNWSCEYYLPAAISVCPKGYDVAEYANKHGGLDYKENFWLKMGYIIVNFEIESIQNGERSLSYINAGNQKEGYCNMWKMEGGAVSKKDSMGYLFNFQEGDFVLYYASSQKSVRKDYRTSGLY